MYLQEFKIYLIGGHVLKAAEEVTIPAEHRLLNRFKKAKPEDILSVGSEETSQACSYGIRRPYKGLAGHYQPCTKP